MTIEELEANQVLDDESRKYMEKRIEEDAQRMAIEIDRIVLERILRNATVSK